jgi:hypothetical protein
MPPVAWLSCIGSLGALSGVVAIVDPGCDDVIDETDEYPIEKALRVSGASSGGYLVRGPELRERG